MDLEVAALAAAAAEAALNAMATDAWEQVRLRLATMFGRGDSARECQEMARLDSDRDALLAAETTADSLNGRIQGRLEILMDQDPRIQAEVEALISYVKANVPQANVSQIANNNEDSTVIQAGRDITGGINTRLP